MIEFPDVAVVKLRYLKLANARRYFVTNLQLGQAIKKDSTLIERKE